MKQILLFSLLLSTLLLTGCGSAIKNVSAYKKVPLKPAKFIPSKNVISGKSLPKVIILDLEEKASKTARKADLGTSLAGEIDLQLTKGKSVEILKRVSETSIDEEMKLAELSQAIGGEELKSADYIISGKVLNARFSSTFQEKRVSKSLIDGKKYIAPAKFLYLAEVKGVVKIYQLPNLEEVGSFDFEDNIFNEEETTTSYLGLGKTKMKSRKEDNALLREAGASGINSLRVPLKNFFAKKGYIYEKRSKGRQTIVKVTLGSKNGAVKGKKVKFYSIEESFNPLTNESTKETIEIGEGEISNQIRPDSSWVIVKKVFDNKELKAGDFIQIAYVKEMSDYINTLGKKINKSGILKYKDTAFDIILHNIHK